MQTKTRSLLLTVASLGIGALIIRLARRRKERKSLQEQQSTFAGIKAA